MNARTHVHVHTHIHNFVGTRNDAFKCRFFYLKTPSRAKSYHLLLPAKLMNFKCHKFVRKYTVANYKIDDVSNFSLL